MIDRVVPRARLDKKKKSLKVALKGILNRNGVKEKVAYINQYFERVHGHRAVDNSILLVIRCLLILQLQDQDSEPLNLTYLGVSHDSCQRHE